MAPLVHNFHDAVPLLEQGFVNRDIRSTNSIVKIEEFI